MKTPNPSTGSGQQKPSHARGCFTYIILAVAVMSAVVACQRATSPAASTVPTTVAARPTITTARPTFTVLPPTATYVVPTPTAAPTVAPTEDTAAAIDAYIREIESRVSSLDSSLNDFYARIHLPWTQQDGKWMIGVMVLLNDIKGTRQRLTQVVPPAPMRTPHSDLLNATKDCEAGVDQMGIGLGGSILSDENDAAFDLLATCRSKIAQAMNRMYAIRTSGR